MKNLYKSVSENSVKFIWEVGKVDSIVENFNDEDKLLDLTDKTKNFMEKQGVSIIQTGKYVSVGIKGENGYRPEYTIPIEASRVSGYLHNNKVELTVNPKNNMDIYYTIVVNDGKVVVKKGNIIQKEIDLKK